MAVRKTSKTSPRDDDHGDEEGDARRSGYEDHSRLSPRREGMPSGWTTITLALIGMISTIMVAVGSPLFLAHLTNVNLRQTRIEDYARQDAVADRLEKQQTEDALRQAEIALEVRKTRSAHSEKLDEIHGLVNSQFEAALQDGLDSRIATRAVLTKLIAQNEKDGNEPNDEDIALLKATDLKIEEIKTLLADRLKEAKLRAGDKKPE